MNDYKYILYLIKNNKLNSVLLLFSDVKLQGDAALLLPEIRRAMRAFSSEPNRRQQSVAGSGQDMCPDGTPEPQCSADPCARAECPQFSRASCV